jgi:peptidoglycan hydrolase-like protein with peptidoglycan-binding domain
MSENDSVSLSSETVEELRRRAQANGFDSVDEYTEYVLRAVLNELDPVEAGQTDESEQALRSRLKSLGYLEE